MNPHGHSHEAPATAGRTIRWASYYDLLAWLVLRGSAGGMRRQVLRLANLNPGDRVLDAGCGTGTLARDAAIAVGASGRVTGIDASPEMIARSRRKTPANLTQLDFSAAAVEALPFDDGQFDVVLSSLMLHHLPRDTREAGLREMRRVLRAGGCLVAVDIADPDIISRAIGHHMPADYVTRLTHQIAAAGFSPVERAVTKYSRYVFLTCRVPA